jgi:hypothetical protein
MIATPRILAFPELGPSTFDDHWHTAMVHRLSFRRPDPLRRLHGLTSELVSRCKRPMPGGRVAAAGVGAWSRGGPLASGGWGAGQRMTDEEMGKPWIAGHLLWCRTGWRPVVHQAVLPHVPSFAGAVGDHVSKACPS